MLWENKIKFFSVSSAKHKESITRDVGILLIVFDRDRKRAEFFKLR